MKRSIFALCLVLIATGIARADLLSYVGKADPSYAWTKIGEKPLGDQTMVVDLKMTSQTWMGIPWTHTVRILSSKTLSGAACCGLFITGGDPDEQMDTYASMLASVSGWAIAILYNIPNQPLYDGLKEDALIAYTFTKALETGDSDWPLLFPMAKSAVRAMDAIQDYMASERNVKVDGFMTFGASKRGWTTWFTGAVDPRVKGIAPVVYDNLSLSQQMPHQIECYGAYSQEIEDYTAQDLPSMLSSDKGKSLATWVDPYTYRQRIAMPKLMIMGTNDPYWTLDSSSLYFSGLYGKKYLLYCPNQGHGVEDIPRLIHGLGTFAMMLDGRVPFPDLSWDCAEDEKKATLSCQATPAPESVSVWTSSSTTRDFRQAQWTSAEMTRTDKGFGFDLPKPAQGYAALFGEYVFKIKDRPVYLSTTPYVIGPDPKTKEVRILLKP